MKTGQLEELKSEIAVTESRMFHDFSIKVRVPVVVQLCFLLSALLVAMRASYLLSITKFEPGGPYAFLH